MSEPWLPQRYVRVLVKAILITALLIPGWSPVLADLNSMWEGARPLGMGGAFIAVADDENTIPHNAAGLGQLSWEYLSAYWFRQQYSWNTNATPQAEQEMTNERYGVLLAKNNLGIGGIQKKIQQDAIMQERCLYLARSDRFAGSMFAGYTFRYMTTGGEKWESSGDLKDRRGYACDLSYLWQVSREMTIGVVVYRVFGNDLDYAVMDDFGTPRFLSELPRTADLGIALYPKKDVVLAVDITDLLEPEITMKGSSRSYSFRRSLRLGAEVGLTKTTALRFGYMRDLVVTRFPDQLDEPLVYETRPRVTGGLGYHSDRLQLDFAIASDIREKDMEKAGVDVRDSPVELIFSLGVYFPPQ